MPLMLLDPERGVMLELPLEAGVLESPQEQCSRADPVKLQRLANRVAQAVGPVVDMYLDYDLRPPSQAQIQYAVAIARREGLEIPADVLKKKVAMGKFLDQHAKGGARSGK